MRAIYRKRLRTLAKFLRTVPKKRFHMGSWATGEFCGMDKEPEHNECGTAACAAGWACVIPEFNKAGLTFGPSEFWGMGAKVPRYKHTEEWDALARFFGLSQKMYSAFAGDGMNQNMAENYLFGSWHPNCPIEAAKRIERYIRLSDSGKLK